MSVYPNVSPLRAAMRLAITKGAPLRLTPRKEEGREIGKWREAAKALRIEVERGGRLAGDRCLVRLNSAAAEALCAKLSTDDLCLAESFDAPSSDMVEAFCVADLYNEVPVFSK